MKPTCKILLLALLSGAASIASSTAASSTKWEVGTPIVTYWAGPAMSEASTTQMAEGGFNLVWCGEKDLDLVQRHGLRGQLQDALLTPDALDHPAQRAKLDALIDRVRSQPALYCYFLTDEPNTTNFPGLGRLVAYLRERDPKHLAYINLFPTYATNDQLGNKGDTTTAYRDHLRQFVEVVKPSLISYDHYQFSTTGDSGEYFLNLALIRERALESGLPFLNIVQAATWAPSMRVPEPDEMRYLVYTTLAYGAQGISYYVYCWPDHRGGIADSNGVPTHLYGALKTLNREFTAIAAELQPLRSLAVYHAGMKPPGTQLLPSGARFTLDPLPPPMEYKERERVRGALLGSFGPPAVPGQAANPTHVVVVNLDYKTTLTTAVRAARSLEMFDAATRTWSPIGGPRAELTLPPGGGRLLRER